MSKNPLSKNEPGVATFCGRQIGEDLLDFFLLPFLLSSSSSSSAELLFSKNPLSKSELPQPGVVIFCSFFGFWGGCFLLFVNFHSVSFYKIWFFLFEVEMVCVNIIIFSIKFQSTLEKRFFKFSLSKHHVLARGMLT